MKDLNSILKSIVTAKPESWHPKLDIITQQTVLKKLGINASIMKLGTTYPLPRKKIAVFLKRHKTVIIVEELSPYLEHAVKKIAFDNDIDIEVIGKDTGHFIEAMEYNVPI